MRDPALDTEPFGVGGQVVIAGDGDAPTLGEGQDALRHIQLQKLREVRVAEVPRREPAEQRGGGNGSPCLRSPDNGY